MKSGFIAGLLLAASLSVFAEQPRSLDRVDPAYRAAAKEWVIDLGDEALRKQFQARNAERTEKTTQPAEHWTVPAQGRQPAVSLYVWRPKGVEGKLPVVYFIHGGGYLLGNARMAGDALQAMADRQKAVVVSLEYRLATEAPFPADLDDAYHGLRYVFRQAERHGLDAQHIVLMGESAGGGLAARLALYTRDRGEFRPAGQVLIYPMLDYRTGTAQSPYRNPYVGEFVWTPHANRVGWATLRGGQALTDEQMPYFSAAMARRLEGLPPTFMMVGDLDLFVNEDIDYANRLVQAGVPTELMLIPGVFHAFEMANPDAAQTQQYLTQRTRAINRMFGRTESAE